MSASKIIKTITVEVDDQLKRSIQPFDFNFDGTSTFEVPEFHAPKRDGKWNIGLIVGPSGSGKSTLLSSNYGITPDPEWNPNKAIVSQVDHKRLMATGLNSVPSWCRPYHVLSNGEAFRARMARSIATDAAFDEFTSVIDRNVAKSASHSLQRFIRSENMTGVVFASCHHDIVEWLQPDWQFDTATGKFTSSEFFIVGHQSSFPFTAVDVIGGRILGTITI
ncbi:hypothetical protein UFOVP201_50 [uncultured Caudovirales phage]|uniref:Uncharacterized protein n=1 Tax=uncultured Caudovirales phage TaxID=2100421 RepID=A0A6J7WPL5_9CAUD|nr:hypothetical protein UFOVP201_50 [uncultured Caudovirales phage]